MFYSNYDCDFLRLCGLCRYIPTDLDERFESIIFRKEVISYMQTYKLIKMQSDKKSFKLTDKGISVLGDMCWCFKQDARMNINRNGYKRKVDSAKLTILLHLAGINVFCETLRDLSESEIGYIVKTEIYNEYELKPLSNSRFLGLLKIYDTVYVPYYVEGYDDWMLPNYERETFMRLINELKNVRNVKIMLVGENLMDLYQNIVCCDYPLEKLGRGKQYFRTALKILRMDEVWLPLNQDGVLQMSIMTIPDYQERIIMDLGATEPPPEYNLCNGIHENGPVIISLDMNYRRKLHAIKQAARIKDGKPAIVVCMKWQEEVYKKCLERYGLPFRTYGINNRNFLRIFKNDIKEYKAEPYVSHGEMIEMYPARYDLYDSYE